MSFACARCQHVASRPFGRCPSCRGTGGCRTSSAAVPRGRALSARRPKRTSPYLPGLGGPSDGSLERYLDRARLEGVPGPSREDEDDDDEDEDPVAADPRSLHVARGLALPPEMATQTSAVLAKRGAGKTYYDGVLVEELRRLNQQVVVVDPVGALWGLAYRPDGRLSEVVDLFGGDRGAPLPDPVALAGDVVARRRSLVLDLSHARRSEQPAYFAAFLTELYELKAPEAARTPLHLVVDEADLFAPQRPDETTKESLRALEEAVRRGRSRGLGCTMSTQRASVLAKDVLTQVDLLVLLRVTSPHDRDAVLEWVRYHADDSAVLELLESLSTLEVGEAWFWSPGWLEILERRRVRSRRTLDSSRTPDVVLDAAFPSAPNVTGCPPPEPEEGAEVA